MVGHDSTCKSTVLLINLRLFFKIGLQKNSPHTNALNVPGGQFTLKILTLPILIIRNIFANLI